MDTPLFESSRLVFRPLVLTDAERLFELHAIPAVIRYLGIPEWHSLDDSLNYIHANNRGYKKHKFGRWVVSQKSGEDFIGIAGLMVDPYEGFVDLGYRFFPEYWGRNYATESANAVVKYGFQELQLTEIEARVAIDNAASERVLQKSGLVFGGETTCMGIRARAYRIHRNEWQARDSLRPQ